MLSIVRTRSYAPSSLLSLNDYRELEAHAKSSSVNNEGKASKSGWSAGVVFTLAVLVQIAKAVRKAQLKVSLQLQSPLLGF
jgi:hypothetical protein